MPSAPSDQTESLAAPRWMSWVLIVAGIYNLGWGLWVVVRPDDLFHWTGIPVPRYPSIWQCVGMVVGVYGIGYGIAASRPYRHWPIVLVGLLGKVLGPVGMLYHLVTVPADAPERLPTSWVWTIVANDLIWWVPFSVILYQAARSWSARRRSQAEAQPPEVINHRFRSQHGQTIAELSQHSPTLVVFLRHSGCTFCREALSDLARQRGEIERDGKTIVLVHLADDDADSDSDAVFRKYGLQDLHRIGDPACELYRAYQLPRGTLRQLFGPTVWWRGFLAAILDRHGIGKLDGDGFQMPGVFLVQNNQIVRSYRHPTAASRPDYCALASASAVS
ncbi:redoxin domain-containing protein [Roseiconus nitratireducens]|uniref:Redoxin domain-containing protein n=1 Tax=Roseiconus nitratireducens TaxID=2605748 RepID=A0A5M6DBA3_9BACT|nr:SelL-related redox protein [Roseiconus nitratireducens]KAA5543786.1 redoxin domain-containing protein [Roseiconus nitratireducens]